MIEVVIHALSLDADTSQPVVLLRSDLDDRLMPIWIGPSEASAILLGIQGVDAPRPLTHDLLLRTVGAFGAHVDRIEIVELDEGTFYANIILETEHGEIEIDARPSDSIAVAVRVGVPVYVSDDVWAEASFEAPPEDSEEEDSEIEVERFREFLAHVEPEDFGTS